LGFSASHRFLAFVYLIQLLVYISELKKPAGRQIEISATMQQMSSGHAHLLRKTSNGSPLQSLGANPATVNPRTGVTTNLELSQNLTSFVV
jgi:hypothetical protein